MRSAVVFYSLEGNTRTAAELLAEQLGSDLFEVRTTKRYPKSGLAKFISGGKDATLGLLPQIEPLDVDPTAYDLVVIAVPVWAGKAAAPMASFIRDTDFGTTRVALMVASASGNADSCTRDLARKLGRATVNLPTLSLRDPAKLEKGELKAQIGAFVERLGEQRGGGGAF